MFQRVDQNGWTIFLDDDGAVTNVWVHDGMHTVTVLDNRPVTKLTVDQILSHSAAAADQSCTRCGAMLPRNSFQHFAAIYCDTCAEAYKRQWAGTCLICGAPRWQCTC